MTLPLAPVSALEPRLGLAVGSLSGLDLARVEAALEDVSALVREEAGKTWIDPDDGVTITAPASVLAVVYSATARVYRNPDGFVSENVGQGAYTWSTSQEQASGAFLTKEERRIVRKAAAGTQSVYTLRLRPATYDPVTDTDTGDLLP